MWRTSSTALLVLASAGALVLTACGSASNAPTAGSSSTSGSATASQSSSATASSSANSDAAYAAIKASVEAARQAKTFRVTADGVDSGKALKLDLHYGSNGVDGSVVTMGTEFKIKAIGNTIYFQAPAAFWRAQGGAQGDAIAARYGDKFVKTSATSQAGKGFGSFSDSAKFLSQFTKGFVDTNSAKGVKQVGTSTVDGTPTKTYADGTNEGTIDIAATGTPYPLRLKLIPGATNKVKGTIGLSNWNEPYTVAAPAGAVSLPS